MSLADPAMKRSGSVGLAPAPGDVLSERHPGTPLPWFAWTVAPFAELIVCKY
jgi:hypothetical protein